MADDWESIVQIEPQVKESHGSTTRDQIFGALRNLLAGGYLRAMDENGYGIDGYPDDQTTAWFSMTDAGRVMYEENIVYYDDN
ncbi:MAG: hypothetical protein JNM18_14610 [Planctomycetaceae bacterium]|nr:hypothetical protein [Planctomycetaceae bacterium]